MLLLVLVLDVFGLFKVLLFPRQNVNKTKSPQGAKFVRKDHETLSGTGIVGRRRRGIVRGWMKNQWRESERIEHSKFIFKSGRSSSFHQCYTRGKFTIRAC